MISDKFSMNTKDQFITKLMSETYSNISEVDSPLNTESLSLYFDSRLPGEDQISSYLSENKINYSEALIKDQMINFTVKDMNLCIPLSWGGLDKLARFEYVHLNGHYDPNYLLSVLKNEVDEDIEEILISKLDEGKIFFIYLNMWNRKSVKSIENKLINPAVKIKKVA